MTVLSLSLVMSASSLGTAGPPMYVANDGQPALGPIAANLSGNVQPSCHVPWPPIECPVR